MLAFKKGFAVHELPVNRGNWQFALFTIGRDWDDDDHEEYPHITWFIQFAFWQFSYTWEKTDD